MLDTYLSLCSTALYCIEQHYRFLERKHNSSNWANLLLLLDIIICCVSCIFIVARLVDFIYFNIFFIFICCYYLLFIFKNNRFLIECIKIYVINFLLKCGASGIRTHILFLYWKMLEPRSSCASLLQITLRVLTTVIFFNLTITPFYLHDSITKMFNYRIKFASKK